MDGATLQPSDWIGGFLFLGNNLALDFLNTRPVIGGELTDLVPDFPALLRWFCAAGLLDSRAAYRLERRVGSSRTARAILNALLEFREQFRNQVVLREQKKDPDRKSLSDLNRLLALHPQLRQLRPSAGTLTLEPAFIPAKPEDLFAPIVHAAATLLTHANPTRIRQCDNCVLHFLDTSKKGTRRWCSMQLCGNRLKVSAYHARQRAH